MAKVLKNTLQNTLILNEICFKPKQILTIDEKALENKKIQYAIKAGVLQEIKQETKKNKTTKKE